MISTYFPGTIGLSRSPGILGKMIRTGERLEGDGKEASHWNHAFIIVAEDGSTIEAASQGVVRNNIKNHPESIILPLPDGVDFNKVVDFAISKLGIEYGYFLDVLLGIDCLTGLKLHTKDDDSYICSELAAAALEAGGWKSFREPALMLPSSLFLALTSSI